MKLQRGDQLPAFVVPDIDGARFDSGTIWQRRNLLLVSLPPGADAHGDAKVAAWVAAVRTMDDTFQEHETTVVVTHEAVGGLAASAIVADRWGEIIAIEPCDPAADRPPVAELREWLRFVAHACPECEGEAR